ncbi:MAG: TAXI family TRAP transporter solute-binding subunit [Rhodospirillaceae bacterium]
MNYLKIALGSVAGLAFAATASAQTIGIGSTKGGAVAQITATISKVVSESDAGLQMRSQTMGGTQQYIPVVNAGELDFAISNISQYYMAVSGTGLSAPNKYENLRLVTNMMKFSVGFVVPVKAGINVVSDLKGKRLGYGFKASPLFQNIHAGGLATAGLTYDDVNKVPAVGLVQSWRMLMEGKTDGAIAAAGSGFIKQMNATIDGGVKFIPFANTPEALAAMHTQFPKTYWSVVEPRKGLTAVREPVTLVTYDYMFWTHKGMSDEVVYKVTKVMHTQAEKLKGGGPLWRTYTADANLAKQHGVAYHPAAEKYYKEAGLWPGNS